MLKWTRRIHYEKNSTTITIPAALARHFRDSGFTEVEIIFDGEQIIITPS